MKTITILHPFTPQAAGVVEASVPQYHSQPHAKALMALASQGYACAMEYFTPKWFGYSQKVKNIDYRFYPVTFTLNGDHKKWKKQGSNACLKTYTKNAPDMTIINMSGHSSKFSYQLSKVILKQNKQYIAMLGGQHYTDNEMYREYYKNAHHILVHTHLQKKSMKQMDMFKNLDIRVFPLGVDCEVFKPNNKSFSKDIKLLYVGRIVEWKRVHLAIEAIHNLVKNGYTDAVLHIIGPTFSEKYLIELKSYVKANNLEQNVFFLGLKNHNELMPYFQEADLFLLPSDKETFGMVMIESMACETPVVGIDCPGGPKDVIESGVDGLLSLPQTYATDVLNLIEDKEKLNTMKTNARQKVINKYSIEQTTKVLRQSVNDALL